LYWKALTGVDQRKPRRAGKNNRYLDLTHLKLYAHIGTATQTLSLNSNKSKTMNFLKNSLLLILMASSGIALSSNGPVNLNDEHDAAPSSSGSDRMTAENTLGALAAVIGFLTF
jgi:hypothetical protein